MDILTAIAAGLLTIAILSNVKINKTSGQLMLLGLELSIVGVALLNAGISGNDLASYVSYLAGTALLIVGLIFNLFGFFKK
ncbi:hypothetical protein ACPWSR_12640 [Alloiococcus sp. CFN-8]|uniref:hypothetical protein n=1 Tax=Alloiococcus sp. CFN-8 TaxID=3416081 RepID=UPI003CF85C64